MGDALGDIWVGVEKFEIAIFGRIPDQQTDAPVELENMALKNALVMNPKLFADVGCSLDELLTEKHHGCRLVGIDKIVGRLIAAKIVAITQPPVFRGEGEDVLFAFGINHEIAQQPFLNEINMLVDPPFGKQNLPFGHGFDLYLTSEFVEIFRRDAGLPDKVGAEVGA